MIKYKSNGNHNHRHQCCEYVVFLLRVVVLARAAATAICGVLLCRLKTRSSSERFCEKKGRTDRRQQEFLVGDTEKVEK
jgi:hypothetical protein